MKVLYISHTSEMQGSGQALLNIIEHLNKKGADIYLVLPKAKGKLYNSVIDNKIKHYVIPIESWVWPKLHTLRDYMLFLPRLLRLLIKSLFSYQKLIELAKILNPDIIHTNVGVVHIGHYVAKKLKIPHVWHIREFQDLDFGWKAFPTKKRFMAKLQDPNNYPIAITKEVYNYHSLSNNINASVIYDGVISKDTQPEIIEEKEKYFLFVGHLSVGKGVKEVVNSFITIVESHPEYELWLAGKCSPVLKDELNKAISKSKFQGRIRFLGFRTDVYSLMLNATALIVASRHEGFGFITAEAMYNGCLVIGKNTAGTREQFDNGFKIHESEIGIRYNTQDELAAILDNICNGGICVHFKMLKNAQKTVIALYSKEKNATNLYNLYIDIISKNGE